MAEGRSGWVTFSWIIFLMAGLVNMLYGAAALVRKEYFPETGLIFQSLQSHGWVWLLFGVVPGVGRGRDREPLLVRARARHRHGRHRGASSGSTTCCTCRTQG